MPDPYTVPEGIPELLIQIGLRTEMLDQDRERLAKLGRINRLGRKKWEKIAQRLAQDDCGSLVRGLVIVERELRPSGNWIGGSVSGAIWVFRVYQERFAPSHIEVADWVFQNRGDNQYLPFGRGSIARTYQEYISEREDLKQRYADHLERQREQKKAKEQREEERYKNYAARLEAGKKRAKHVRKFNADLATIPISERLGFIARSDMPLEAVSKDLLVYVSDAVTSIDPAMKSKLIQVIGRRKRGFWGRVKRVLDSWP